MNMYKLIQRSAAYHAQLSCCIAQRVLEKQCIRSASTCIPCSKRQSLESSCIFVSSGGYLVPISVDACEIYQLNRELPTHKEPWNHCHERVHPVVEPVSSALETPSSLTDVSDVISRQTIDFTHNQNSEGLLLFNSTHNMSDVMHNCQGGSGQMEVNPGHPAGKPPQTPKDGPSEEQLMQVKNRITEEFDRFFTSTSMHPYHIYTEDIVFENNYWGNMQISHGIKQYALQITKLRAYGNIAYCGINQYVIKITMHPEDGTIKLRWTLRGIPQIEGMKFWKWNMFNKTSKDEMRKTFKIHDGFSTFWVNKDGLIYKQRLDKVMPDNEKKVPSLDKLTNMISAKTTLLKHASATKSPH